MYVYCSNHQDLSDDKIPAKRDREWNGKVIAFEFIPLTNGLHMVKRNGMEVVLGYNKAIEKLKKHYKFIRVQSVSDDVLVFREREFDFNKDTKLIHPETQQKEA